MMGTLFTAFRLLTFRSTPDELRALKYRELAFGLGCTWLVGMGRWWEDPKASLLQHLGLGSVAYVFILAFFLWLVLWPLTPLHWSLLNVLIFVTLTSPPAILYAIPVRHGLALQTAQAIVFVLTVLNLERVVFDFMGGIRASGRSVNDTAYGVLFLIAMISTLAFLPLLACYLVLSVHSIISKYGRRWGHIFYGLALALAGIGVVLNFYRLTLLGCVLMGSGFVIAVTAMIKLDKSRIP